MTSRLQKREMRKNWRHALHFENPTTAKLQIDAHCKVRGIAKQHNSRRSVTQKNKKKNFFEENTRHITKALDDLLRTKYTRPRIHDKQKTNMKTSRKKRRKTQ